MIGNSARTRGVDQIVVIGQNALYVDAARGEVRNLSLSEYSLGLKKEMVRLRRKQRSAEDQR